MSTATNKANRRAASLLKWQKKESLSTWDTRVSRFIGQNREKLQRSRGKAIKEMS
jgi:hypothetical protein